MRYNIRLFASEKPAGLTATPFAFACGRPPAFSRPGFWCDEGSSLPKWDLCVCQFFCVPFQLPLSLLVCKLIIPHKILEVKKNFKKEKVNPSVDLLSCMTSYLNYLLVTRLSQQGTIPIRFVGSCAFRVVVLDFYHLSTSLSKRFPEYFALVFLFDDLIIPLPQESTIDKMYKSGDPIERKIVRNDT